MIVRWNGPAGEEALTLRAAECKTVSAIGPASCVLASALERWRAEPRVASNSVPPPGIGPVTARTLAQASAPRDLPLNKRVKGEDALPAALRRDLRILCLL